MPPSRKDLVNTLTSFRLKIGGGPSIRENTVGQVGRSRSKVKCTRSKNLYMGISMELLLEIIDGDANEATEEYDCTDTAQGVFNAYAVLLLLLIVEL